MEVVLMDQVVTLGEPRHLLVLLKEAVEEVVEDVLEEYNILQQAAPIQLYLEHPLCIVKMVVMAAVGQNTEELLAGQVQAVAAERIGQIAIPQEQDTQGFLEQLLLLTEFYS
jgi:hypothetical protein